jgi:hypothetical protein
MGPYCIWLNGLRMLSKHDDYPGGLNSNPSPPEYNEGVLIAEM